MGVGALTFPFAPSPIYLSLSSFFRVFFSFVGHRISLSRGGIEHFDSENFGQVGLLFWPK